MWKVSFSIEKYRAFILGTVIFIILYALSTYNYLLFHSIAEIFSILVALGWALRPGLGTSQQP